MPDHVQSCTYEWPQGQQESAPAAVVGRRSSFNELLAKVVEQHNDVLGADKFLKTAQFAAALAAVGLEAAARRAAAITSAGPTPLRAQRLLDVVTAIVSRATARYLPADFSLGLRQLVGQLSTARLANHFCGGCFGMPAELENCLTGSWEGHWCDPHVRWGVRLESWLNVLVYYPLEHAFWLGWAAPGLVPERWRRPSSAALPMDGGVVDSLGRWSCGAVHNMSPLPRAAPGRDGLARARGRTSRASQAQ